MRLILLRHAKSSWDTTDLPDFERQLSARGRRDAPRIATDMAQRGYRPELLLVSSARRTRETLCAVLQAFAHDATIRLLADLYGADERAYLHIIATHGRDCKELLILGHNPSIQETAIALVGGGDQAAFARMSNKFPTSAYAVIDFGAETASAGTGHLECFIEPRMLE